MTKVKVLFLGADPHSDPRNDRLRPRLKIDEEMREITTKLRAAEYRDALDFTARLAVRADDLLQALNEVRPHVVHFSGHGSETGEIIVVGRDGTPRPISGAALRGLFQTLKGDVRVVLLNACYTESQSEGTGELIDCVIGMNDVISDEAGITFAASFYRAIGFGRSVQEAFDQGRTALMLEGIPEDCTPRLSARQGVDPARVILVNPLEPPPPPSDVVPVSVPVPATPGLEVRADRGGVAIGGDAHNTSIIVDNRVMGETPEEQARKLGDSVAVIRDELQWNLQRLASQIAHTRINVPAGDPVPRRPGETRAQFEDRDRDGFGREVEYLFSMYEQFSLEEAVFASQRVNLPHFDEKMRLFTGRAYAAVNEARNRLFLYRDRMQKLSLSSFDDSQRRGTLARLYSRQTANVLSALWFEVLENWLMLEPDETATAIVQEMVPQVLGEHARLSRLTPGQEGWRYATQQRARLHAEKMSLDMEEASLTLKRPSTAGPENRASDFADALGRASLAYLEGSAEDAVEFLQEALRFPGVPEDRRHFAKTSLDFLRDADAFDGALGAYLLDVQEGGPAAGCELRRGDVIIRYNGVLVTEPLVLSRSIAQAGTAPHVPVEAVRDGVRLTRYVKGGVSLCVKATALVYVESLAV